jgi:glycosyltransferase involved in cell wall biosynthesis
MVGFHFPPSALSSGHLRLLAFTKYLPDFGWNPIVLSATSFAYETVDPASVNTIPAGTAVHRALSLDTRRHIGIFGKYPSVLAQPDRWISWWPAAVLSGLRLIKRHRIRAIWSTYPIMTAHCVAHTLNRAARLPWIADFRDPVVDSVAGKTRLTVHTQMRCERRVVSRAAFSVFTTPGAVRACEERYPSSNGRITLIPNGFDEDDFVGLAGHGPSGRDGPLHFVHAGVLYPGGRNPLPFFEALASLKQTGAITAGDIHITLRASGCEDAYQAQLERLGISEIVTLAPFLPYRDALEEQVCADGLLLFQGPQFDRQIPAKLYEYMRLGRPIFGLVGMQGDTATLLRSMGNAINTPIDAVGSIAEDFARFVRGVRQGSFPEIGCPDLEQHTRKHAARQLAGLLDQVDELDPRN